MQELKSERDVRWSDANLHGQSKLGSFVGPDSEFMPGRVQEVEAASAGECEDGLGDRASSGLNSFEAGFQVVGVKHHQHSSLGEVVRLGQTADFFAINDNARVVGPVVGESPCEGLRVEGLTLVYVDDGELEVARRVMGLHGHSLDSCY